VKVLVTGSSGRFGPCVVEELSQAGHDIVTFSRGEPPEEIRRFPWVQGDLTDFDDCLRATDGGIEAIQHVGAQSWPTDHPRMREGAEEKGIPFDATMSSNIMGTYYLLQAALRRDIEIFVMTGSNCALGHGFRISDRPFQYDYLPIDEEHPTDPEDSYSFSKLVGEQLLESYTRTYGMRTYALRSAGITDAERRQQMADNAQPAKGWNAWLWAWIGTEDIAVAQRLLMEKARDIDAHGAFFCNNDDTSALEPSRELVERFRPDLLPLVRDLDGHATFLSNRKLRETVGWAPQTSWRNLREDETA
jgi:nucleoside-diphosphate-sugar epimerase